MATSDEYYGRDIRHEKDFVRTSDGLGGDIETLSGFDNLKAALLRRLITSPGAVVHRPNYGVGIKDYQGAPITLPLQRRLALRIAEQFEQDDRVEEVSGVSFSATDETPEKLQIAVRVIPVGLAETELKFIPFGGEGT